MAETLVPENSTIREMRARIDELTGQLTQAQTQVQEVTTKLTEKERAEMAEIDRLKSEKAEAESKLAEALSRADQVTQYESVLQEQYDNLIAAAPEANRETLKQISQHGGLPERIRALQAGMSLIGGAQPTPVVRGTVTQPSPATPQPTPAPTPQPVEKWDPSKGPPTWDAALQKPAKTA